MGSWLPDEFDAGTVRARQVPAVAADIEGQVRLSDPDAQPYLTRLLGLTPAEARATSERARKGDRTAMPGAVRASA